MREFFVGAQLSGNINRVYEGQVGLEMYTEYAREGTTGEVE